MPAGSFTLFLLEAALRSSQAGVNTVGIETDSGQLESVLAGSFIKKQLSRCERCLFRTWLGAALVRSCWKLH